MISDSWQPIGFSAQQQKWKRKRRRARPSISRFRSFKIRQSTFLNYEESVSFEALKVWYVRSGSDSRAQNFTSILSLPSAPQTGVFLGGRMRCPYWERVLLRSRTYRQTDSFLVTKKDRERECESQRRLKLVLSCWDYLVVHVYYSTG